MMVGAYDRVGPIAQYESGDCERSLHEATPHMVTKGIPRTGVGLGWE